MQNSVDRWHVAVTVHLKRTARLRTSFSAIGYACSEVAAARAWNAMPSAIMTLPRCRS